MYLIGSYAISLAIVILITESPTNGFTIRRTKNITKETKPETYLSTEETLDLKVKTLTRANDISVIDSKNEEGKNEIMKNNLTNVENISTDLSDENETRTTLQDKSVTKIDEILSTLEELIEETTVKLNTTEASSTNKSEEHNYSETETEDEVHISQSTTESDNLSISESVNKSTVSVTSNSTDIETSTNTQNVSQTVNNLITTNLSEVIKGYAREITIPYTSTEKSSEITINNKVTKTHVFVNSNGSVNDENSTIYNIKTDVTPSDFIAKESTIFANNENQSSRDNLLGFTFNVNYNMTPEASETFTTKVKIFNEINNKTVIDVSTTPNIVSALVEVTTSPIENSTSSDISSGLGIKKALPVPELPIPQNIFVNQSKKSSMDPSWKKYTIIYRKRASLTTESPTIKTEESITTENLTKLPEDVMMKAETLQTHISLDKVFTYTPIPSLDKLREDLLSTANQPSTKLQEVTYPSDNSVNNMLEINSTTSPLMSTGSAITKKFDIVSTKRAGFLDNSVKTTAFDLTTFANLESKNINYTKPNRDRQESEAMDNDRQLYKNVSGVESYSQLAEDAIKEELLKEMTLNDHEENNEKRHRDERFDFQQVKGLSLTPKSIKDNSQATQEIVTEYTLNVQPISQEKTKNTSLYTVSPNYKPMKKIDVQPPKQFVRDPDDNSWRNESISSLGIVFKPKNSSKPFTQVLKNKTETEFSNLLDKDGKSGLPDLRERLEKIAEVRKSKKKRIDKFGEVVYTDYEESNGSGESTSTKKIETVFAVTTPSEIISSNSTTSTTQATSEPEKSAKIPTTTETVKVSEESTNITKLLRIFNYEKPDTLTTQKPNKLYNIAEYYDSADDYDADYLKLSKIDIKKFTTPPPTTETSVTQAVTLRTKPMGNYLPDRKPTIQYFPPRKPAKIKVNINNYDDQFERKVNLYTQKDSINTVSSTFEATPTDPVAIDKPDEKNKQLVTPAPVYKPDNLKNNLYLTHASRVTEPHNGFAANDGNFNRASYVIKHYRDFIDQAAKDDDERNVEYTPFTQSPMRGVTMNELVKVTPDKPKPTLDDSYDYDQQFRKDILNRFVDNFNQNSERFKVDFPVLYNSSVVHRKFEGNGKVLASSSAFIKRLYEAVTKPNFLLNKKYCDPNCDNMNVELSPAYELHYYVPEQEEKEEVVPTEGPIPYRYRL